ncbi:MAG: phosphatase PAP2 family protein [Sinobacteraceae bacterium]|nr:phosphatase PAP2 family protein [Nevskiaceae bacterium]
MKFTPRFDLWHAYVPLLVFGVIISLLVYFDVDRRLAERFFVDTQTGHWLGEGTFWADILLHRWGRNFARLLGVLGIVALLLSFKLPRLRPHRRALGYYVACMAVVPLLVGGLKVATNVDCPRDLQGYGGDRPYVELFDDRPDELPRAECFPGAHSSSAFALFCLYFLGLAYNRRMAWTGLAAALTAGSAFSFAQQARGAHFIGDDLWSAAIAWAICYLFYRFLWRGELRS